MCMEIKVQLRKTGLEKIGKEVHSLQTVTIEKKQIPLDRAYQEVENFKLEPESIKKRMGAFFQLRLQAPQLTHQAIDLHISALSDLFKNDRKSFLKKFPKARQSFKADLERAVKIEQLLLSYERKQQSPVISLAPYRPYINQAIKPTDFEKSLNKLLKHYQTRIAL